MNSRYLIILRLIRYKAYNNNLVLVNNRGKCEYILLFRLLYLASDI